ncbi:hypothetical protein K8I31_09045, partial [bacterium]|nr:hypothetical protein [bacterium]
VEEGSRLATESNDGLIAIQNSAEEVATKLKEAIKIVQSITESSTEQAFGAEQIKETVASLDQVTQQNSSTSEESAAASEELATQAQVMNELVARFKIDSGEYHSIKQSDSNSSNSTESQKHSYSDFATLKRFEANAATSDANNSNGSDFHEF